MRRTAIVMVAGLLAALLVDGAVSPLRTKAAAASSPCGLSSTPPATYNHVIWIWEENHSYSSIVGSKNAPYINALAAECGLATNYHNISHHSLPNYIGATNGADVPALSPFYNDCSPPSATCDSTGDNIFNQSAQSAQSTSWKSYQESMATNCDKKGTSVYADRHDPPIYYTDLATSCPGNDVPLGTTTSSSLINDFQAEASAPAFSFVTPNICDDMHGAKTANCTTGLVQRGDAWLSSWMNLITSTPVYLLGHTAIFIVWDEGTGGSATAGESCFANTTDVSCHVPLIVVAPSVHPGTTVAGMLSHYSLLKTTEDLLGYPELGMAASASSFLSAFNL